MKYFPVLLVLFFAPLAKAQTETLVDRIVAVVNDEPILYSEINIKISQGQPVTITSFPAAKDAPQFEQSLQDEINFELIMQKIEELEITVSDQEVEEEINKLLRRRNLDMNGLTEFLRQQGMSFDEYKRGFRDQIILSKFQGRVINPSIKITDKDVETYYLKKVGSTYDSINIVLRNIYIKIPTGATDLVRNAKRDRAREVYQKLKDGMKFDEAARLYSDLSGATENGGLMGGIKLNEFNPEFRSYIEPLGVGEFTEPIETPAGYYMFYMDKKSFSGSDDFKRQKGSLERELRARELESETKKWLTEQRRRSKVKLIP